MEKEYQAKNEEYLKKLDKNAAKYRKKICGQISDYVEEFIEENNKTIQKHLASIDENMLKAVREIIESRLNTEIERQKKKMDKLIEDSKASDALRDEKLQKAQASENLITDLLGQVAELQIELEELNDTIEEK